MTAVGLQAFQRAQPGTPEYEKVTTLLAEEWRRHHNTKRVAVSYKLQLCIRAMGIL